MGVTWGIVRYPADYDGERLIKEWRPLADAPEPREFSVMRGDHRFDFQRLPDRDAGRNWGVHLSRLAQELLAAGRVAKKLRMLIQISF